MGEELPEAAPPPEGGSNRGALIIVAVALTIVAAGVGFGVGRLTAPSAETEAASPSTTTTTITIEAVGDTLDWSESADIGETWPVGLVEHGGTLYLFGTPDVPFGPEMPEGSGLDAWEAEDDGGWEPLGSVISSPALVQEVVSTPQGLIAMGTGADGGPVVWMSPDARDWTASPLPSDGTSEPGTQTNLSAAGANDDVVVVFGSTFFNPDDLIAEALGADFDEYGIGYGGPAGPFTVYGPLGIPVFSATAEELGIDEQQLELAFSEQGPEQVMAWSTSDGVNWVTSELGLDHVMSASTNEDGELVALGYGRFGMEAWTSTDGVEWTSQGPVGEVDSLTAWNDGFIGVEYFGPSAEIVYSEDGEHWEPLGAEQLLPEELSWSYWPLAAGGAGIATVAHGYDEFMEFEGPEPMVLERDGYTLTIDQERGSIVVADGETTVIRLSMGSERVPDEVVVDLDAETMTFLDPESGEALMTFTFEELEEAEQASFEGMDRQVFLFSPDGSVWSVQDLADFAGSKGSIDAMFVTDDRVVALVASDRESFAGPPEVPHVKIWTGLVP